MVKRSHRVKKQRFYYKSLTSAKKKEKEMRARGFITTMSYAGKKNPITKKTCKLYAVHAWK